MPGRRTLAASTAVVLLLSLPSCHGRADKVPSASRPNAVSVLLITIDTLRADHVGAYGYPAARTPTLDGVAKRGVRFDRAFATAPLTLTSHASLLTGRYPARDGVARARLRDGGLRGRLPARPALRPGRRIRHLQ